MRGETQASSARLGTLPARVRWATWADARVRKRKSEQSERLDVMVRLAAQRREALRAGSVAPVAPLRRAPY
jgi:hypothetical protein